ncbi:MAG: PKD domain-containing protein, partial [Vicinamibacterales bacterium]
AQTTYDPAQDGIDFYESLEGMLVQINDARVTGPTNRFGEIWGVGDFGFNATGSNARGGITLVERAAGVDYNPERIQLDDGLNGIVSPGADVGDGIALARGVVAYNFGNFEVALTELPVVTSDFLPREVSIPTATDRLTVAAYNVENLSPADPEAKFAELAGQIVDGLGAPDILALSEVQDDNGPTNDGAVAADLTLALLIDAIASAGGPSYAFVQIDPVDDQDGGQPGGNIRVVQLYNPARVSFVPGTTGAGDSTTATAVGLSGGELALSLSPGRIAPTDGAWSSSRKPLAVTYDFNGRRVLVINNHFNSKGGDQPLFGVNQPPLLTSEIQRRAQATLVHDFVFGALALDPQARVVVLGDLNDFDFSPPLRILRNGPLGAGDSEGTQPALVNLGTQLVVDPAERYSYVFEGNSQELDHVLSTPSLFTSSPQYQAVHTNAEYSVQTSDHDPLIASFLLPANVDPVANAGTDRTVAGGTGVSLDGTASSDADGSIESYAWTQTAGTAVTLVDADTATPSFVTPGMAGALTFRLTITDDEGASAFDEVTITVTNDVDTVPDAFEFTDVPDAPSSEVIVSNAIMVRGIDRKTAIGIASSTIARYSINGGRFRAGTATVKNGDQVRLQIVSAIDGGESRSATLTIGGVSDTWTVTTGQDAMADPVRFDDRRRAQPGALVTSRLVTISGISVPVDVHISGDESALYSINGGAFTSEPGVVNNGDTVQLLPRASTTPGAVVTARLGVGSVSAAWNVMTRP